MASNSPIPPSREGLDLQVIRCETALSRYPIHHLSKGPSLCIDIRRPEQSLHWQVSYSTQYGPPGPLAYKLDTLVVHRRLDQAPRTVPHTLKLGSLREIAAELRLGADTNAVRKALLQNASPFITAKITYKARDKSERTLEAAFHRYSVVFTGEKLPDGRKADAVYLLLNDFYMEILNHALTRPLDYDYLRALAPLAQRFYEIVSYPLYAALKTRQRARLAYSELCLLSTMKRYFDYDRVKKQMYKVHAPHLKSGYLEKVEMQAACDEAGQPDWQMFYRPGPKARRDHRVLASPAGRKGVPSAAPASPEPRENPPIPKKPQPDPPPAKKENNASPSTALVRHFYETFLRSGTTARPTPREQAQAQELIDRIGADRARTLVEYAAEEAPQSGYRPRTFGGILHYEGPFLARYAEQERQARQRREQAARKRHEAAHTSAYHRFLRARLEGDLQTAFPQAARDFQAAEEHLLTFHRPRVSRSKRSASFIQNFADPELRFRRFLDFLAEQPHCGLPSFWQWDAQHNPAGWDRRQTQL